MKIVDRKTPGSGEERRWLESNLAHMVPGQDELKFVLCGPGDYAWAKAWCEGKGVLGRLRRAVQPRVGRPGPRLAGGADRARTTCR